MMDSIVIDEDRYHTSLQERLASFSLSLLQGKGIHMKTCNKYKIGFTINLVFNPIMVGNYAAFFNCTPVGRASDSMMAPT